MGNKFECIVNGEVVETSYCGRKDLINRVYNSYDVFTIRNCQTGETELVDHPSRYWLVDNGASYYDLFDEHPWDDDDDSYNDYSVEYEDCYDDCDDDYEDED